MILNGWWQIFWNTGCSYCRGLTCRMGCHSLYIQLSSTSGQDWLIELRFYIPFITEQVISDKIFPANLLWQYWRN